MLNLLHCRAAHQNLQGRLSPFVAPFPTTPSTHLHARTHTHNTTRCTLHLFSLWSGMDHPLAAFCSSWMAGSALPSTLPPISMIIIFLFACCCCWFWRSLQPPTSTYFLPLPPTSSRFPPLPSTSSHLPPLSPTLHLPPEQQPPSPNPLHSPPLPSPHSSHPFTHLLLCLTLYTSDAHTDDDDLQARSGPKQSPATRS